MSPKMSYLDQTDLYLCKICHQKGVFTFQKTNVFSFFRHFLHSPSVSLFWASVHHMTWNYTVQSQCKIGFKAQYISWGLESKGKNPDTSCTEVRICIGTTTNVVSAIASFRLKSQQTTQTKILTTLIPLLVADFGAQQTSHESGSN